MSKRCAREECGKIVYPLEELKCLDKVWHKGCFRCTVCGMALNMKNYKGYNKMPYCEPHYPKTVASVVSDTPEMRRIAGNTKLQSQVQYHAEYEKMKGTKIQIADDPEISRHMLNTKVQSQVAYTGELLKKQDQEQHRSQTVQALEGGKKESVSGDQTSKTPTAESDTENKKPVDEKAKVETEVKKAEAPASTLAGKGALPATPKPAAVVSQPAASAQQKTAAVPGVGFTKQRLASHENAEKAAIPGFEERKPNKLKDISMFENPTSSTVKNTKAAEAARRVAPSARVSNIQISSPQPSQCQPQVDTPYTSRLAQQSGTLIYSSEHGGSVNQSAKPVGSIADYDPLNGNWGTVGGSRTDHKLNGSTNGTSSNISASQQPLRIPVIQTSPHTPRFCSDFVEEAASRNGGLSPASSMSPGRTSNGSSVANSIETGKGYGAGANSGATGFSVKAIYDYTAADKDEVTFLEGDVIVNCQKVDEGWMTGTVQRTLQWGMLPANYVEPHKLPTGLGRLK